MQVLAERITALITVIQSFAFFHRARTPLWHYQFFLSIYKCLSQMCYLLYMFCLWRYSICDFTKERVSCLEVCIVRRQGRQASGFSIACRVPWLKQVLILVSVLGVERFVGAFDGKHLCVLWWFVPDEETVGIFAPAAVCCSTMLIISAGGTLCCSWHHMLSIWTILTLSLPTG